MTEALAYQVVEDNANTSELNMSCVRELCRRFYDRFTPSSLYSMNEFQKARGWNKWSHTLDEVLLGLFLVSETAQGNRPEIFESVTQL